MILLHPSYNLNRMSKILVYFSVLVLLFIQNNYAQDNIRDTVVYGSDNNFPPFEYLDEKGNPTGLNVDLIKAIAKEMDFPLKIKLGVWKEIRKEFEVDETVDISDMYYFKEREEIVEYAIPHEIDYDEIYVLKGENSIFSINDLNGKKVITQSGSTLEENLRKNYPKIRIISVLSEPHALELLSQGKYDAAIVSSSVGRSVLEKKQLNNIINVGTPFMPREYSFVVKKGNTSLLKLINTGLFRLKENGEYDKIRNKWIPKNQPNWFSKNIILVAVIFVIFLLLVYTWIVTLRFTVQNKTKELQLSEERLRTYLEDAPIGIALVDSISGRIYEVNSKYCQILEQNTKELEKLNWMSITHPDDIQPDSDFMEKINSDEISSFKLQKRLLKKDGSYIWVNLNVSKLKISTKTNPLHLVMLEDISKSKEAEEELLNSKKYIQTIFDSTSDAIFIHDELTGKILDVNQQMYHMFGYEKKEVIGLTVQPLSLGKSPYSEKEAFNWLVKSKTEGKQTFEWILKKKDGHLFWAEVSIVYIQIGNEFRYLASVRNIDDRKLVEEKLKESEEKFRIAFNKNPDAITISTIEEGKIIEINPSFTKITGYVPEEVYGKKTSDIDFWANPEDRIKLVKGLKEDGYFTELEFLLKMKDGTIKASLMNASPITINNKSCLLAIIRDIDDRKKIEGELRKNRLNLEKIIKERTKELEQSKSALLNLVDDLNINQSKLEISNQKLKNINAEMEAFTYSVSHDLKAPLRGIDGYSKLLIDLYKNELNEEAIGFLKNIRLGTLQMNLLIEDLLSYSRLERQEFHIGNVVLQPLINELLILLSGVIKKSKAQIKMSFSEDFMLLADTNGLKLVLRNLIDNALKFSSKSKDPQIEIGSSENSTHWLIFVKDNGVGFDMKYHDRIFKIFHRLHLPEEYEGTGIGLTMVEKAIHRMNGKIWAESELNKGTCFYIEFKK